MYTLPQFAVLFLRWAMTVGVIDDLRMSLSDLASSLALTSTTSESGKKF